MAKQNRNQELELVADGLLTVAQATAHLALSRSALYALMDNGELEFVKIGKSRRIPRRCVNDLAARNLRGGWNAKRG